MGRGKKVLGLLAGIGLMASAVWAQGPFGPGGPYGPRGPWWAYRAQVQNADSQQQQGYYGPPCWRYGPCWQYWGQGYPQNPDQKDQNRQR